MNVEPKKSVRRAPVYIHPPWHSINRRDVMLPNKNTNLWKKNSLVIYCALFFFVSIQIYFLTFFLFFFCSFHLACDSTLKKFIWAQAYASNKPIYANDAILPSNSFQSSIKCEMLWVAIWFHINSADMSMLLLLHHYNLHSSVLCALWYHIICEAYTKY